MYSFKSAFIFIYKKIWKQMLYFSIKNKSIVSYILEYHQDKCFRSEKKNYIIYS